MYCANPNDTACIPSVRTSKQALSKSRKNVEQKRKDLEACSGNTLALTSTGFNVLIREFEVNGVRLMACLREKKHYYKV